MKHQRILSLAACALVGAVISGCQTPPTPAPKVDEIDVALDESMARVNRAPAHALDMDSKAKPATLTGGSITIRNYSNEAAVLLKKVAAARGMKFKVEGPMPRLPLFVNVDVENVSFTDFLQNVGHQFGQRADIVLTNDTIEILYRGM